VAPRSVPKHVRCDIRWGSMNIDSREMPRYIERIWCDSSSNTRRNIGNDEDGWTPVRATRHRAHARGHSSRPTLKGGLGSKKGEEGWGTMCARAQKCYRDALVRSEGQNDPARYARRASARASTNDAPCAVNRAFYFYFSWSLLSRISSGWGRNGAPGGREKERKVRNDTCPRGAVVEAGNKWPRHFSQPSRP
jgi:hypothetical protein